MSSAAAMDRDPLRSSGEPAASVAGLLRQLEERSRTRPDRVLRLLGTLPAPQAGDASAEEPFELLIFRGFSSLTTHPTDVDPDRAALPEGSRITSAELLQAPLDPQDKSPLAGPAPVEELLQPAPWP